MELAENLDLNAAEPLRQKLLELRGAPIVLDASRVERLGGLCLQVLLSAHKTWAADGYDFRVQGCSPELMEQLRLFGADDLSADLLNLDASGASA